ncbi:MFS transporter [Pseudofrankia asymbiotica]|uniref:Major facilitator superfamily (MFS) profile domain-containing protein n=1 Tax=Pseudofrankia asymbiotica TaxID=1834516 RepID=A0A1V2IBB5_9ACTN|nr:MFS transporter [Pseudofrankia asymbiotica]ONH28985.1 hypothetical protein BL253_18075 [Pseudofrankia asymbiotica]
MPRAPQFDVVDVTDADVADPDPTGSDTTDGVGVAIGGGDVGVRDPGGPGVATRRGPAVRAVGATVVLLGLTSLLTDLSTEMVTAVLPLYLVSTLGFTPFQYGLVNGLYQGVSAVTRLAGGFVSDRFHRHRDVAVVGYGLSAAAKVILVVGGPSTAALSTSLTADRIGKGIRTAPRDAMLSLAAPPAGLGRVFGVHRAMDTLGAMLGPFTAFALLAVSPDSFDLVFVLSACVGLVGVAVIVLLVRQPIGASASTAAAGAGPDAGRGRGARSRQAGPSMAATFSLLRWGQYRRLTIVAVGLALCTIGDGFVYLRLQQQVDLATKYFPLLAAGVYCVYLLLAIPLGHLADAVGRRRVFVGGYLALTLVYAVLWLPSPGTAGLLGALALLGVYYAATDGVLAAAVSALVPSMSRTGGLALTQTGVALAQLAASAAFGALWMWRGPTVAFGWVTAAGVLSVGLATVALRRSGGSGPQAGRPAPASGLSYAPEGGT